MSRHRAGEIAFTARKQASQTYDGSTDTVLFEDVITDVGNMYSPELGEFTAALPGVYYFNVAIQVTRPHAPRARTCVRRVNVIEVVAV